MWDPYFHLFFQHKVSQKKCFPYFGWGAFPFSGFFFTHGRISEIWLEIVPFLAKKARFPVIARDPLPRFLGVL